jgi:hypothetical protein
MTFVEDAADEFDFGDEGRFSCENRYGREIRSLGNRSAWGLFSPAL